MNKNKFNAIGISNIEETYVSGNAHYNQHTETWACEIRNGEYNEYGKLI